MGRPAYSKRPIVDDLPAVKIKQLKRACLLVSEKRESFIFINHIKVKVNTEPTEQGFTISLSVKGLSSDFKIVPLSCHYGKERYYFICKDTGKRVTALYYKDGRFLSRHQLKAVYQVTRDHRSRYASENLVKRMREKERRLIADGHPRRAKECWMQAEMMEFDLRQAAFGAALALEELTEYQINLIRYPGSPAH